MTILSLWLRNLWVTGFGTVFTYFMYRTNHHNDSHVNHVINAYNQYIIICVGHYWVKMSSEHCQGIEAFIDHCYALLTHCRLLAPYYIMDLDHHWFNCWLVTKTMMTSSNGNIFRVTGHFMQGIHRSPVNSPHKGQWRGALMFSLIYALNKQLSKQSWGWWFETLPHPWRHCNGHLNLILFSTECLGRYFHNIVLGIKTFFHKKNM